MFFSLYSVLYFVKSQRKGSNILELIRLSRNCYSYLGVNSPFSLLWVLLRSKSAETISGYSLWLSCGLHYSDLNPKVLSPQAILNCDIRFPQPFGNSLYNTWAYYLQMGDLESQDEPNIYANYSNTQSPRSYSLCSQSPEKIVPTVI